MKQNRGLDVINRGILRVLSSYEHLTVSDLWCEIGEGGTAERITEEELQKRLKFLKTNGYVRVKVLEDGEMHWAFKKK